MFIDMKGWTSRTSKSSREELKKLLDEYENLVFPALKDHNGKVIKGLGDAYLIRFSSPTNAILCSLEIQKRIKQRNKEVPKKDRFVARVGIDSGEVYERGGDIFGEPVNLAARIQSVAKGGEVAFGESTLHAMNKNEIKYTSLGKHKLKGIDRKVHIYEAHEKSGAGFFNSIGLFFRRNKKKILVIIIILILLGIATNRGNKPITEYDWRAESRSALEEQNMKAVKDSIRSYENTPEHEKDFIDRLIAAQLYAEVGREAMALGEFQEAIEEAENNPRMMMDIYQAAKDAGFDLPEAKQVLEDNSIRI